RFDFDVRNKLRGDWEGLKITNYQITGEHAAERMYAVVGDTPVLEVYTGIGATTFVLARRFSKVYALDLDTDRLEMTKRNLKELNLLQNVELINGDILDEKILDYLSKKKINGVYSDVNWKKNNDWQDWVTDI